MNELKKYYAISVISAKANLAYVGEVASRLILLGVILYVFMRLWTVTYAHTGASVLGGLTLTEMLWYLVITESITMSAPTVTQLVDEDVRTGALAVQLVRPLSYPLYRLFASMGERLVRFVVTLAAGVGIALYFVGPIPQDPANILPFCLALMLAFVLDFLGNFLVGLCAFWIEDTNGLLLIYSRLTMVLGGMLIPLQLFPESVRPLVASLPFSSILYGPAHVFVKPAQTDMAALFGQQFVWIAVFSLVVALVYAQATKRITAHGG